MTLRPAAATAFAAALLLTGCGAVGEAAGTAASDAASRAASAAAQEVNRQICAVVKDGLVSAEDRQALAGLVSCSRKNQKFNNESTSVIAAIEYPIALA